MTLGVWRLSLVAFSIGLLASSGCGSEADDLEPNDPQSDAGADADPEAGPDASGDGPTAVCGDDACSGGETCESCPEDCGECGPPSCAADLTCGETSCCATSAMDGSVFAMGRSVTDDDACPCEMACSDNEEVEHDVSVGAYELDLFEVTVGRFRAFVEAYQGPPQAGDGAHPRVEGTGWDASWDAWLPSAKERWSEALGCDETFQTWTDAPGDNEVRPINCVTWYEAFAFCAWDGGRLPTEAEWEHAAAGGSQNRLYPWGSEVPDNTYAVFDCGGFGGPECTAEDIQRVGSRPSGAGRWGHRDLAGNLYEWVLDDISMSPYADPPGAECVECVQLGLGGQKVIRGGSFSHTLPKLRSAARDDEEPTVRRSHIGFRCAR